MENTTFIVMGVSGCGKSTIGKALAETLGIDFYDGDDFHPEANILKMQSGQPLNDTDRAPWLKALNELAKNKLRHQSLVIACSALKQHYRDILSQNINCRFIYLKGSIELIQKRLAERKGHFMPPHLLHSQFETLEEPETAIEVDISKRLEEIVSDILTKINA